jgi:hypothetical protein
MRGERRYVVHGFHLSEKQVLILLGVPSKRWPLFVALHGAIASGDALRFADQIRVHCWMNSHFHMGRLKIRRIAWTVPIFREGQRSIVRNKWLSDVNNWWRREFPVSQRMTRIQSAIYIISPRNSRNSQHHRNLLVCCSSNLMPNQTALSTAKEITYGNEYLRRFTTELFRSLSGL